MCIRDRYSIYVQNKDFINARKSCLYVKRNAPNDLVIDNVNIQEKASEDFNEYEKFYIQHFLEQPYIERKLIVPVKSYSDLSQKKLAVVDINHLPTLNFPIGHPVANQLYVGHPYICLLYTSLRGEFLLYRILNSNIPQFRLVVW